MKSSVAKQRREEGRQQRGGRAKSAYSFEAKCGTAFGTVTVGHERHFLNQACCRPVGKKNCFKQI